MDSESRHELQQNDLEKSLRNAKGLWERHGTTILVALLIVIASFWFFRWRSAASFNAAVAARQELASAFDGLNRMDSLVGILGEPQTFADGRDELVAQINAQLRNAQDKAEIDPLKAEALVMTGQLSWKLAKLPTPPEATTRPSLGMDRTPQEHLADAEAAFKTTVDRYSDTPSAIEAKFGLAAIAENRREFDEAQTLYEQIKADSNAREGHKTVAAARIKLLDTLRITPVMPASTPAMPATLPSTQPATQPAE